MAGRQKFNDLLQQVVDESTVQISKELLIDSGMSIRAANIVMSCLQRIAGGEGVYIGTGRLWHLSERDKKMYKKFTGSNHRELSCEYGITIRRVYDILKAVEANKAE